MPFAYANAAHLPQITDLKRYSDGNLKCVLCSREVTAGKETREVIKEKGSGEREPI